MFLAIGYGTDVENLIAPIALLLTMGTVIYLQLSLMEQIKTENKILKASMSNAPRERGAIAHTLDGVVGSSKSERE